MQQSSITPNMGGMILCIFYFLFSQELPAQSVDWLVSLDKAQERAVSENKLILADFWAFWCGPCLAMDHQVWNQAPVRSASQRVVPLRLDFDKEFLLNNRYGITEIPAMLILDGYGNKLFHISGYKSVEEMSSVLKSLPSNLKPVYGLIGRSLSSPDSTELIRAIADQYQLLNVPQVSNKYYDEFLASEHRIDEPMTRYRIYSRMALNYHLIGKQGEASDLLEECIENDVESPDRPMQLFLLTKISLLNDDEDQAVEYFELLKSEFPDDKHSTWAAGLFKQE